ncbi:MAG: universal stress protein [Acidimicrobiales bacterium]
MANQVRITKVLVGADPSPGARVALEWAAGLAAHCDAEIVLVHARGLLEASQHAPDGELPQWLADLVGTLDAGLAVSLEVADGPPPEALLRAAERAGADVIVVGRRGAGSPFELTLGSTSREVSSRATVPVLVVPAG